MLAIISPQSFPKGVWGEDEEKRYPSPFSSSKQCFDIKHSWHLGQ